MISKKNVFQILCQNYYNKMYFQHNTMKTM